MMFKQQATRFTDTIQMEKHIEPALQTEVTSIPIVIDAPPELVWQLIGGSAIPDWYATSSHGRAEDTDVT